MYNETENDAIIPKVKKLNDYIKKIQKELEAEIKKILIEPQLNRLTSYSIFQYGTSWTEENIRNVTIDRKRTNKVLSNETKKFVRDDFEYWNILFIANKNKNTPIYQGILFYLKIYGYKNVDSRL